MGVRTKIILTGCVLGGLLIALMLFIVPSLVTGPYEDAEEERIAVNVQRVTNALSTETEQLTQTLRVYSTSPPVDDPTADDLERLNLDLIAIRDADGAIRTSQTPDGPATAAQITTLTGLEAPGFIRTPDGYALSALVPLESDTLIGWRVVDAEWLADLSAQLELTVALAETAPDPMTTRDDDTIRRAEALTPVNDSQPVSLQVSQPRIGFETIQTLSVVSVAGLVAVVVLTIAAGIFITDRVVINPLVSLDRQIAAVGRGDKQTIQADTGADGEIARLTTTLNQTFDALRSTRNAERTTSERLQLVINRAPVILITLDADLRITLMEGRGLEAIDIQAGQFVGQHVHSVIDIDPVGEERLQRAMTGETFSHWLQFGERYFELHYSPLTEQPGEGVVCVAVDATERYEIETGLRQANEAKTAFLANMSHELRTPLNAIIGFISVMLMRDQLNEKDAHRAERVRVNGNHLLLLIDDMLELSRVEAGRLSLVAESIDPRPLVDEVIASYQTEATDKGLELAARVTDAVPSAAKIDLDALRKIMRNLISNGIKFTKEGTVKLTLDRDGDHLKLVVTDTGIGIPAHMHDVIFERFRMVDASATRPYGGIGLGVALVHALVQAMDGTVQLDSDINAGTTVTVRLPVLEPAETP